MSDLFTPLDRAVSKYRSDVHRLTNGAPKEALVALEGHLGRSLPPGLRTFLTRHNGAQLFRGALRIRSSSDVALADEGAPQVVLFADGNEGERWAWARDGEGFVFGTWSGEDLKPVHESFQGWLSSSIALLDTRVRTQRDIEALRLEANPSDVVQLVCAGERALAAGRSEEAESHLRQAIRQAPHHVGAWSLLGDALVASDRAAARQAWLQALRNQRLPLAWPGAPCVEPALLSKVRPAFSSAEAFEKELAKFLDERVTDVGSEREAAVVTAATRALAHSLKERGRRSESREVLTSLLGRCGVFTWNGTPWTALVELASIETDLGFHDDAEKLLRRLRREGPDHLQGRGLLNLARIAVARQEPWAEEICETASTCRLDADGKAQLLCVRAERALRLRITEGVADWLGSARRALPKTQDIRLPALVALLEGDLARVKGDARVAQESYRRGLGCLGEHVLPDIRYRLALRLGDLALDERRAEDAHRLYTEAARGFSDAELPVREAWALLRLAQVTAEPQRARLLDASVGLFKAADLAAGVAAVDTVRGRPGTDLEWHLVRSSAHARSRHDAQRSRPPWERADADRPERRLGAHRLAVAACGDGIVDALRVELEKCSRAITVGSGRALDPAVVKYIAAADLISAHRSYTAARTLLEQLLQRSVDGPARRALQGAIARSPNAALVDGLLSTVEHPSRHPAPAVAEAAELLGLRREKVSVPALVKLVHPSTNPIARKAAVTALGRIGDRSVVDHILPCLDEPALAEVSALALLLLGDRRGVDFHGRAMAEGRRDLSGSPGEIVGRYGGPSHLPLLLAAADGDDERALGAIQGLGLLGDPRGIPVLLKSLSSRNRQVIEVASGALQILTGIDEDPNVPGFKNRWHTWYAKEGGAMTEGVRHRDGDVFDLGMLIKRMEHPDAWTRRTAYDELVILSGMARPFDADGPWRIQQAHLRAWRQWWVGARSHFAPGKWTLHGREIG
ncbi:MAG: HEAT repeat domain-containing protein [Proteobacteria bacterium]|nr:HEAT repeat domain-containing protein [Pseudomonadota bacterium]